MQIMNWNILSGGGNRVSRIATHIRDQNPTLCVLTEYRLGISGEALKAALHQHGYIHCLEPDTERSRNSAAIFSQMPLGLPSLPLEIPEGLRPYMIVSDYMGLCLIGAFCARADVGIDFVKFLGQLSSLDPEKSYLAVGDFFFGPRLSDPNHGKALRPLKDAGWVNAWDSAHQDVAFWSCQTNRGKSRPDHFYLHGPISMKPLTIESFSTPPLERLSDHLPITVSFQIPPIHPESRKGEK